jgi:hypothetical protein
MTDTSNTQTNEQKIELLVEKCLAALAEVHAGSYDSDKNDRTAAMFLETQMKLSMFISDVTLLAKEAKNEVKRIEAETYHTIRSNSTGKITEGALDASIAKDPAVVAAKQACAQAEADSSKWENLIGTLAAGHVFFRNLGKNRNL